MEKKMINNIADVQTAAQFVHGTTLIKLGRH